MTNAGLSWTTAEMAPRHDCSWQAFTAHLELSEGPHTLIARATGLLGDAQPMAGARNHVHSVSLICER